MEAKFRGGFGGLQHGSHVRGGVGNHLNESLSHSPKTRTFEGLASRVPVKAARSCVRPYPPAPIEGQWCRRFAHSQRPRVSCSEHPQLKHPWRLPWENAAVAEFPTPPQGHGPQHIPVLVSFPEVGRSWTKMRGSRTTTTDATEAGDCTSSGTTATLAPTQSTMTTGTRVLRIEGH